MKRKFNSFAIAVGLAVFAVLLLAAGAGESLTRPVPRIIGAPPAELQAESLRLIHPEGGEVVGWLARGQAGQAVVLLLHPIRTDRRVMVDRALFLHAQGYSVLLIDLPAHGESSGQRITFGLHEAEGVKLALNYLRTEFPQEKVGVIGVSLGAASLLLAHPQPAPDAVILESMFPRIEDAVTDRLVMRLGMAGRWLSPLLLYQLPWRLGIHLQQLHPIDEIGKLNAPLLIASGMQDQQTTWQESEALFAAANAPKQLWGVAGAIHQDLYTFAPDQYQLRVLAFFDQYLRHQ